MNGGGIPANAVAINCRVCMSPRAPVGPVGIVRLIAACRYRTDIDRSTRQKVPEQTTDPSNPPSGICRVKRKRYASIRTCPVAFLVGASESLRTLRR
ncbi:hypothetical protein KC366_g8 [Hortaea werneckii]|nr:hypothetical protein KC366_g8 [Hortaea werneckii]